MLEDFSLHFKQGGTYAIIGASGSGKSMLARALIGRSKVCDGNISIGGTDVREIPLTELYKNVLYIPQNTFLFEGTVLENISFFGDDVTAKKSGLQASLPESFRWRKNTSFCCTSIKFSCICPYF